MIQSRDASDFTESRLSTVQRRGLIAAAVGFVLAVAGLLFATDQLFQSYLFTYLFLLGITLGSLAWLLIHDITGGRWGLAIRPFMETAASLVVLMALLFVPLLFGLDRLYIWAQPEAVAQDAALQHKEPYLNIPFFAGRAALYFVVWAGAFLLLHRWWRMQARERRPQIAARLRRFSAPVLALYGITITFGSFDWLMSLDPHWFSTIFGVLVAAGQALTALAFAITVIAFLRLVPAPAAEQVEPGGVMTETTPRIGTDQLSDLGNLLLTAVIFWSYIAFMQYFIIWSGNLPEDVLWYLHRLEGGWSWLPLGLLIFHFAIPFVLLLSSAVKRNPQWLAVVALLVLAGELVHLFWIVAPTFSHSRLRIHWLDLALPIFLGGLWIAAYAWRLRRQLPAYAQVPPER